MALWRSLKKQELQIANCRLFGVYVKKKKTKNKNCVCETFENFKALENLKNLSFFKKQKQKHYGQTFPLDYLLTHAA